MMADVAQFFKQSKFSFKVLMIQIWEEDDGILWKQQVCLHEAGRLVQTDRDSSDRQRLVKRDSDQIRKIEVSSENKIM